MKSIAVAAALLMVGSAVFASVGGEKKKKTTSPSTFVVFQNATPKFKLVYLEQAPGEVLVNIKDDQDNIIFKQRINNQKGFSQQYDFEELPYGKYSFEVTQTDGSRVVQNVTHRPETASPKIKANVLNINDGKKFRLAVLKYNELPVNVSIYDHKNELVHSEMVDSKDSFRKTYDLTSVDSDSFRFEINNNQSTLDISAE